MLFHAGNTYGRGGARCGAGRKPTVRRAALTDVLKDVLPEPRVKELLEKITEAALNGDMKATGFLLSHLYGRPAASAAAVVDEVEEMEECMDLNRLTPDEIDALSLLLDKAAGYERHAASYLSDDRASRGK